MQNLVNILLCVVKVDMERLIGKVIVLIADDSRKNYNRSKEYQAKEQNMNFKVSFIKNLFLNLTFYIY